MSEERPSDAPPKDTQRGDVRASEEPADDLVPASVRLGNVVPPEDPEDWTRPLTWVAAIGMLVAPLVTLAWFVVAPPVDGGHASVATFVVGAALAGGAAATGSTQIGALRAGTAALGAGLFGALVVVMLGVVMAGERQVGVASPTLAHAFAAAVAGLAGVVTAALLASAASRIRGRFARLLPPLAAGVAVAVIAVGAVLPA
jgi:hypothetical protein